MSRSRLIWIPVLLVVLAIRSVYYQTSVKRDVDTIVTESVTNFNDTGLVPKCSTSQRLAMVDAYCQKHRMAELFLSRVTGKSVTPGTGTDLLDLIPDDKLLSMAHELWLDPHSKVIVCMHAKAACSSWKTILANNSGDVPLGGRVGPRIHQVIFQRGMRCADEGGDVDEIRRRLRTWYKIAIVRHPFDRLVSGYEDKLVRMGFPHLGRAILAKLRPPLPEDVISKGKGVQFQDLVEYILDGYNNDHFKGPYNDKCHLCLFNYDYIVKTETNDEDADFIINSKLRGRGGGSANMNNIRASGSVLMTDEGRDLHRYFRNLSSTQHTRLRARNQIDLDMFGYSFSNNHVARCSGNPSVANCC